MAANRTISEVTFQGTHHDRGLQRGERLGATLTVPDMSALSRGFVAECRRQAEEVYPPCADEFDGLLREGGFDRGAMEAYYFARLAPREAGCTMFAVEPPGHSAGAGPMVGRNFDWTPTDLRWCELQRYDPADGLRRIAYTNHWAGCPDVLNERGLYLAIASLPDGARVTPVPGVQWSILVDAVTETCATVAEAVAVCRRVAHLRSIAYLLADASGAAAVVEGKPSGVHVRRAEDGVVTSANVALGTIPQADLGAEGEAVPSELDRQGDAARRGVRRLRRTLAMLCDGSGAVTEGCARRVLSDHRAPICTGDHDEPDGGRWATIWSGICLPAQGAFRIAPGLPCRHAYQTFTLNGR